MSRLQHVAPELYCRLQNAPLHVLRAVVLRACRYGVVHSKLAHPDLNPALDALQQGTSIGSKHLAELQALAETLDEEYFDLQDAYEDGEATAEEVQSRFGQARAVAALVFALGPLTPEAAAEAIYEAAATVDDPSELLAALAGAL